MIYNFICPHCGKLIRASARAGSIKRFDSPLQRCPYCGKYYFDRNCTEVAIMGKEYHLKHALKKWYRIVVYALFLLGAFFSYGCSLILHVQNRSLMLIAGVLIALSVIGFILIHIFTTGLSIPKDFDALCEESYARMKDLSYTELLEKAGGKIKNYSNRPNFDWIHFMMLPYPQSVEAPMAFHKFNHWVYVPLKIFGTFYILFEHFKKIAYIASADYAFFVVDMVYCVVVLELLLVTFIGFFRRSASAFKANIVSLILGPIYILTIFFYYAIHSNDIFLFYLGTFILSVMINLLILAYYRRRRLLFSSYRAGDSAPDEQPPEDSSGK